MAQGLDLDSRRKLATVRPIALLGHHYIGDAGPFEIVRLVHFFAEDTHHHRVAPMLPCIMTVWPRLSEVRGLCPLDECEDEIPPMY